MLRLQLHLLNLATYQTLAVTFLFSNLSFFFCINNYSVFFLPVKTEKSCKGKLYRNDVTGTKVWSEKSHWLTSRKNENLSNIAIRLLIYKSVKIYFKI